MSGNTLQSVAEEMRVLFEERLRLKGRTLDQQIYKAGRTIPKKIRADAQKVVQALEQQGNPKLSRMIDEPKVVQSGRNVIAHLKTIDPIDRLKGRVLNWLGAVSAFGILLFVAMVWIAVERGLV